ncbi:DUF6440 family protein [Geomicrobium sp. JCM 19038]|uniref:DUF6440 family protein n=1 Tax=Geomicrobium sp. JCM 19038 TaxID=1460635 RepID=UPI00045F4184|nr:DUF6440 family protein [Geomicrobium sp. JCM 19038]GAK09501.1 hypothetical protein JCM19038_3341 [Geomicrobium sp. JCM 19038]
MSKEKRFTEKDVQHYQYGLTMVIVDNVTGVHYLQTWQPQGVGLTPLLDENGEVFIEKP